ncbi:MAG: hypothetical protein LBK60_06285 [Verrucomicrobiales bacterium]|nr:hypothetical protein [Verrucomicrobiales bacterium]
MSVVNCLPYQDSRRQPDKRQAAPPGLFFQPADNRFHIGRAPVRAETVHLRGAVIARAAALGADAEAGQQRL